jgi:cysteine-rich repeat protein
MTEPAAASLRFPPIARCLAAPFALLLAGALAAGAASAHEQNFPIPGDQVQIRTDQGPGTESFSFQATGPQVLLLGHDPTANSSALLVRGVGPNAGRTPLIELAQGSWTPTAQGFAYTDPTGDRGGVTNVVLEGGQLSIQASGSGWPWSPAGPQDAVWVQLRVEEEWYCAAFVAGSATIVENQAGHFEATDAPAPAACPEQVCGNRIVEPGEQCDDGNLVDNDGCDSQCHFSECSAQDYPTTYDAIQHVIFEGYGCAGGACHDSLSHQGDLDLTAANSYEQLLGADGLGEPSPNYLYKRVEPSEPSLSLLYLKVLAKKQPIEENVGSPMPVSTQELLDQHLEALRLWIRGGAPHDGVVEGTSDLLGACLPPPSPLKIPVPAPPEAGVQLQETPWPLLGLVNGQGEDEICMATYYDFSGLLPDYAKIACPEGFRNRKACSNNTATSCEQDSDCGSGNACVSVKNATNYDDGCFAYHGQVLYQDPQSHHSIISIYTGGADTTDAGWGAWTYKFEPDDPRSSMNGQPCDPTDVDPALGYNPGCSGAIESSIACIGYGPDDASNFNFAGGGGNTPQFSGSQEPYYQQTYADGVYSTLPHRGIVIWNSHAFNLTDQDSTMAQYLNLDFAKTEDQVHPARGIFDARWIFSENVPPFETQEVCATHTVERGTRLFELSSHRHQRGVLWRTWGPPNTPCQPGCPPTTCLGGFCLCTEDPVLPFCTGPREDAPLYYSTVYNDPLQLDFDPPMVFDSPNVEDRTFLFCSVYDNGATPESPPVKRQSTSPVPPNFMGIPTGNLDIVGGPCPDSKVACLDGPYMGMLCGGNDSACDSAPGAGDGLCDACPVHGGVTTEDEMFILLGSFYLVPEPSEGLLGLAALGALGLLARGRSRARS